MLLGPVLTFPFPNNVTALALSQGDHRLHHYLIFYARPILQLAAQFLIIICLSLRRCLFPQCPLSTTGLVSLSLFQVRHSSLSLRRSSDNSTTVVGYLCCHAPWFLRLRPEVLT